jgi:protein O-GlcNAc transferase
MDDALAEIAAALTADPAQPPTAYLQLVRQLYQAQRYAEGEHWAAQGLVRHPGSHELWNIRGVFLRVLQRRPEALAALDRAIVLKPDEAGARVNRGNLLLDMGDGAAAAAAFTALVAEAPGSPLLHHHLGRALTVAGRPDLAAESFRKALAIKPDQVETWQQLARLMNDWRGPAEAEAILDEGLAANPNDLRLSEAKALVLRASGQRGRTETYLQDLAERYSDLAWVHFHLGDLVAADDRPRGLAHLRRALALEPGTLDHVVALAQALERGGGPDEAAELEEANGLARQALALGATGPGHTKVLRDAFSRVCDFEASDALGDFKALGRGWAAAGMHSALLRQMPRVRSAADRGELLEQHRIWARAVEARAAATPVSRPPKGPRSKIRLGVMSSDLRSHVVTSFAQPIFDHIDSDRFEVYAYSFFQGQEDPVQARIASQVAGFRWRPDITNRAAAQTVADDGLDVLVELGGSTHMNKLEVMAWRPATLQASWLGYPHSSGLAAIDRLVCDPLNAPADPKLMIERPLMLPRSWIALGPAFTDQPAIAPASAEDRNGFVTFGTANSPYKYTSAVLRTWAEITALVPNARFAFIRPEAAAPAFRRNVLAEFAAEGVGEDRVVFHAVRGGHLPFYNEVDISLDTFPLTGGTTTVEALWMGVPVVSLVGEAFFERLSYSILTNAGIGDLCAGDLAGYVDAAIALAGDRDRRRSLRATLRQQIRQSPLGQPEAFARDFYNAFAAAV